MEHRAVVDVIVRPEYAVRFEQVDEHTLIHVEVHHWSHRIAARFKDDIDTAHHLLGRPVYALERPEAPNQPKFLARYGFRPCGHVRDAQGRVVAIYERSLDGQLVRWWHDDVHPEGR